MKKGILVGLLCVALIGVSYGILTDPNDEISVYRDNNSIEYMSKVDNNYFYIYKQNKWNKIFIKGVNIGAAKPGYFPGEFGITKSDYLRWFRYISDMNANTLRVYTILTPAFYDALYEFNKKAENPLYLIQGVWIDEESILKYNDAYNPRIKETFKSDIKTMIDVLHGNKVLREKPGHAYGVYDRDIPSYVIGYVLGLEWDPEFVVSTNEKHLEQTQFDGHFLYSQNASPFEVFLCDVGDCCIKYETSVYQTQKPVSFTNWVTTDMLNHPNEPLPNEDLVSVNMESIKKKDAFKPGIFASYHIYPYYPDLMNFQQDYINFTVENGRRNTYRAYLRDLRKKHTIPVLVAEFGVPSARGKAHDSLFLGYNQGNITEKEQGEMDAAMLHDIYEEGYAGGLIFSFQDEWFKRTWNTMEFDIADRRPYWNNQQTNEQHFGLLAFDSGENECTCYVDGDMQDWDGERPLSENGQTELYMKSDEAYLYFMVKNYRINSNQTLVIPIDSIPGQGNWHYQQIQFERDADFVIIVNGKDNSKILVDSYYDSFQYIYGEKLEMIPKRKSFHTKNSGEFVPMYLCTNKELFLPQEKVSVPFQCYETGALVYGNSNPSSKSYNSLSDFYTEGSNLEIRIPWQLLNVMDPSSKSVMDDLHNDGIKARKIQGIFAGVATSGSGHSLNKVKMNLYSWDEWNTPIYHERLKLSYYIIKEAFAKY